MSVGETFIILFCFLLTLKMCLATKSSKSNICLLYLFELSLYGLTQKLRCSRKLADCWTTIWILKFYVCLIFFSKIQRKILHSSKNNFSPVHFQKLLLNIVSILTLFMIGVVGTKSSPPTSFFPVTFTNV